MNVPDSSGQVWSLLVLAAMHHQAMSHELVGKLTGMSTDSVEEALGRIESYCVLNGLPPLSALVVRESSDVHRRAFIPAEDASEERGRIFEKDWIAVHCPSCDELAAAARQHLSRGAHPERSSRPGDPSTSDSACMHCRRLGLHGR